MRFKKNGQVRIEQLRDEIRRRVVEFPTLAIIWNGVDAVEIEDINGLATQHKAAIQAVIDEHVPQAVYFDREILEVEITAMQQQKAEFLNLPNWSTWTPAEAKNNVSAMITGGLTLEQCQAAIDAATTIASLRPILKNIVRAIYAIESVLSVVAQVIIYIRNLAKNRW